MTIIATVKDRKGRMRTNKKAMGGPCIFPFKYKKVTHDACIKDNGENICATEINPKTGTMTKYGYCPTEASASPKRSMSLKKSTVSKKASRKKTKKVRVVVAPVQKDRIVSNFFTKDPSPSGESITKRKTLKKRRISKKRLIVKEPKLSKAEKERIMEELFGTPSSDSSQNSNKGPRSLKRSTSADSKKLKSVFPSALGKPTTMKRAPRSLKRNFKIVDDLKPPSPNTLMEGHLNNKFVDLLEELADIMQWQGEQWRAKSYREAAQTVMTYPNDITDADQLKGIKTIGSTILSKLKTFQETGTLPILERERKNPMNLLTKVYGIGPKKAKELIVQGISTLEQLREHPELLTKNMKIGLEHFDDIESRIPRVEIEEYHARLEKIFKASTPPGSSFDIVGSYRRGAANSGDIDLIITNRDDDRGALNDFIDALIKDNIVIEVLTRGETKSLTVARLEDGRPARRVDFLYTSPEEYAFAILYFTGSKTFNTVMRQRALNLGYTLNEHGIYHMVKGKKGAKVEGDFPTEQSIFKFLGMEYREPVERKDTRSMKLLSAVAQNATQAEHSVTKVKKAKRRTLKKPKIKVVSEQEKPATLVEANIATFKAEGVPALKKLTEAELSAMINAANDAYYQHDTTLLTDNEYDILREFTLDAYPENEAANEGHMGAEVVAKQKVSLPYQMWSMDKIKPDTSALGYWMKKYNGPYVLSAKLDGVSGLYSTEGEQPKLYTRGNGIVGQDVSHMIPYLQLPKTPGLVIRGEFIIPKQRFADKYASKFSNPRNFVAGVVNQKTADASKYRDIDFMAYELIQPQLPVGKQFEYLTGLDVEVVRFLEEATVTNELLSEILLAWRSDYKYEIDGVICAATPTKGAVLSKGRYCKTHAKENPENAFAFKMVISDQVAETKVLSVIWTASKHGLLKPRVQIEPVVLGGAKIEFATGFNAKFIEDNRIGMGALIQIVRSGDVIPHILSVVEPAEQPQMPSVPYVWNETHVDIMLKGHEDDPIVREKTITAFFKALGVEGLGAGNVKRIIAAGYTTIPEILRMSTEDFMDIEGFKRKSAEKLHNGIAEKVKEATLPQLMYATTIFGRGFGTRRFEAILEAHPDILVSDDSEKEKVAMLAKVHGMAAKSAQHFVEEMPRFIEWMYDANLEDRMEFKKMEPQGDPSHPLFGKVIVPTGIGTKEKKSLSVVLKTVGASLGSSVKKDTLVVLVTNPGEDTEKAEKARELGIPIMLIPGFLEKYGL